MIYDENHPDAHRVTLTDCKGTRLGLVRSFDTETEEVELFVMGANPAVGKWSSPIVSKDAPDTAITVRFKLPGAIVVLKDLSPEGESTAPPPPESPQPSP